MEHGSVSGPGIVEVGFVDMDRKRQRTGAHPKEMSPPRQMVPLANPIVLFRRLARLR
jgi:hypothetical protein